ncbi:MAG: triose-phosphate isomerase [Gammaproteobacteria bacterium]|nr:triose-phosphate isomerase [Pseudomonadales bacterium]MCP5347260.1 triose-phosphate isomerase [Pseudomonadales bacterium]
MRRKLVAGNWKMHGSRHFVEETLRAIVAETEMLESVDLAVCPTLVHLPLAESLLKGTRISLGAQNVHDQAEGAYTGEVSAPMLAEYAVTFVIVGHSERRQLFSESDKTVADKFMAVQAAGMKPVLCLGESLQQREQGVTSEVVLAQLDAVIDQVGASAFDHAVVAYEPIWAIGTGRTATPEQAQEVHAAIRQHLAGRDREVAERCRILYGGSVNPANADELFAQPDIDGGLVGGASLKAADFASISQSAS